MLLHVACNSCRRSFPARQRPGLVRCDSCEERHAPRLQRMLGTTVVMETPGEAWD